jgi:hypothetical protein
VNVGVSIDYEEIQLCNHEVEKQKRKRTAGQNNASKKGLTQLCGQGK